MPVQKPFNLFIYGTLTNPSVFRAVLGRQFVPRPEEADGREKMFAHRAILSGYKMVSPDNTYLYAVPDRHGRISGLLVGPLPAESMAALRRYEGRNYRRRTVTVQTSEGPARAVAFFGHLERMKHSFGYHFQDPFKQEVLLGRKIEAALEETGRKQLHSNASTDRRAVGELHGNTIRDIMRKHFEAGGISDYAIRRSLLERPLPDFSRIRDAPAGRALATNYLALVIRQVIFNELEENIHRDFRYELDRMQDSDVYYDRTISSLAALRVLNRSGGLLDTLTSTCVRDLRFDRDHLVDYVRRAVQASDALYDSQSAKTQIQLIQSHLGGGHIPLGAELEFSNIGHDVIRDPGAARRCDAVYDGFLYFNDFALDVLTWKLGGHIDNHHEKVGTRPRRGFFELALGNLSVAANISKPITDDPWLLNQLIHETLRFYPVGPHSMHISLQLRSQHKPVRDRLLPLSVLKCLFLLAGDPARSNAGLCHIGRLTGDEIVGPDLPSSGGRKPSMHMLFSEISKRHSAESDESSPIVRTGHLGGRYVQQYKFLRLSPHLNYEPIIMALKGLQLHLRPGSFLTARQYEASPKHRERFQDLMAWGRHPTPVSRKEREELIELVSAGLMTEQRGRPAHSHAYIAWSLEQIRTMINRANQVLHPEILRDEHAGATSA